MEVSNKNYLVSAIEQSSYLKNFRVIGAGDDISLYSYETPHELFSKLKKSMPSVLKELPTMKITYGYNSTSLLDVFLNNNSIECFDLFIRRTIELDELTSCEFVKVQKKLALFSKNVFENEQKIYQNLKDHLRNFSKSPAYIYDRAMSSIYDLETAFATKYESSLKAASVCSRSVRKYKVKKTKEDQEKLDEGYDVVAPKRKNLECRHFILNIMAFIKRYKKIHPPAALIFFIREYPLLFTERMLPGLSNEEIESLVKFSKMENINKRFFGVENNHFDFLDFLTQNGCFAFIEETLNLRLSDSFHDNWSNYKKYFLKLEKIKDQIEQEFDQERLKNSRCLEFTDKFAYTSKISDELKIKAEKTFSKMVKHLFEINLQNQSKNIDHYVSFKLKEVANELSYKAEINISKALFGMKTQIGGFQRDAYFQSFKNTSVILLNNKSALSYIYKYDPSFFLSFDWTAKILSGDQTEKVTSTKTYRPDSFWNHWEKKIVSGHSLYKDIIHPSLKQVVLQVLSTNANPFPSVLEICGGKGHLAKNILDERPGIRYTLLEFNDASIKAAQELLRGRAKVMKADIVNDSFPVETESDVIFGSGAFTYEVLPDRNAGLRVINKIFSGLKKEGFLVLSGLAPSLFTAKEFTESGFKVLNMSASDEKSFKSIQLYILRK